MTEIVRFLLIVPLQLLVFFGLPYLVWRRLKRGRPATNPLPIVADEAGGRVIPVVATFVGIRGLPWIALATNSLGPRLTITPTGMTFRVLRTQARAFSDIEQVDVRTFGSTVALSFVFKGTPFTFDANVGSVVLAVSTLTLIPKSVARSDRAAALAAENAATTTGWNRRNDVNRRCTGPACHRRMSLASSTASL
jgi:hypothetical protein